MQVNAITERHIKKIKTWKNKRNTADLPFHFTPKIDTKILYTKSHLTCIPNALVKLLTHIFVYASLGNYGENEQK